jgi:hypothetical protein
MVGPVGSTDEGSDVAPSPAWDWAFRWNDYGLKEIPCSAEPCPFPSPYPPDAPLWMSPEDWENRIRGMVAFDLSFGPVLDADNPVRVFVPEAFAGTVEVWWHRTGEAGWRVGETFRVEDRVLLAPPPAGMEGEATYQVVVRTRNGVRWAVGPARTVWVGSMGTSRGSALIPQGFAPGPQGLAPMEASPLDGRGDFRDVGPTRRGFFPWRCTMKFKTWLLFVLVFMFVTGVALGRPTLEVYTDAQGAPTFLRWTNPQTGEVQTLSIQKQMGRESFQFSTSRFTVRLEATVTSDSAMGPRQVSTVSDGLYTLSIEAFGGSLCDGRKGMITVAWDEGRSGYRLADTTLDLDALAPSKTP